jgi:hypothetical protein
MGMEGVDDIADCLRIAWSGTSILLLFPTNCHGGFLFQFFLVRRGVQE